MKSALARALSRVIQDLARVGCDHALVGGLAVSARGEPRFTRDIDIAIAVSNDEAAEAVVSELGYPVDSTVEQEAQGRLAAVRLVSPGGKRAPVVDLLFASSGIEAEVCARADEIEIVSGLSVLVARRSDLVALKVLAESDTREQDRADLISLLRSASEGELHEAEEALELIDRRGYARGKDLKARLAHFSSVARAQET